MDWKPPFHHLKVEKKDSPLPEWSHLVPPLRSNGLNFQRAAASLQAWAAMAKSGHTERAWRLGSLGGSINMYLYIYTYGFVYIVVYVYIYIYIYIYKAGLSR